MNGILRFAGAALAVIGATSILLAIPFSGDAALRALWFSGWLAFAVQVATFAVARRVARENIIAAWGAGALTRIVALIVYALAAVKPLELPAAPALVSFATCLFLTTLIEPLFLKS